MASAPPRTPPRKFRVEPEMMSDSPTKYSPVRVVMDEETSVEEARLMAERASTLEEKLSKYRHALTRAEAAVAKANAQVREAEEAFSTAEEAEQTARSFPVSAEDTAKKERATDAARRELENARTGYQRLVTKRGLIAQKVQQYQTISSKVTATLGGKKHRKTRRRHHRSHKRKTVHRKK